MRRLFSPHDRRTGEPGRTVRPSGLGLLVLGLGLVLTVATPPTPARAGTFSWLDEIVQQIVVEARGEGKAVLRGGDAVQLETRTAGRLFAHGSEEGLERLVRKSDELALAARRVERPSDALLQGRFRQLLGGDAEAFRSFSALKPAEKRVVVELGESAQRIARRYPQEAETMIRKLGPEGLTAVRAFGDDVAEVLVKEGSESLGVLRKTGKGGWEFFTHQVLPHKKKLAAAGVLTAFLANPEKFVDYAGQATEYAVHEFAKAGITLAAAVGGGAVRGLESTIGQALAQHGLDLPIFRWLGMAAALAIAFGAILVLLGMPLRILFRPFTFVFRRLRPLLRPAA